jgi:hypothetical protein
MLLITHISSAILPICGKKSLIQVNGVALEPGTDGGEHASVFQLTLHNAGSQRLWVHLQIHSPLLSQGCDDFHPLDPMADVRIQCPQKIEPDGSFALSLKVFDDIGNTHVVERARLKVSFGPDGAAQVEWE